jgi:IS30 family transposase
LGFSPSSISREIKRHKGIRYRSALAQECSRQMVLKRRFKSSKILSNPLLEYYIQLRLKQKWSPQQIVYHLKAAYKGNKTMQISHESIYSYIYVKAKGELKKELINGLRQSKSVRRKPIPRIKSLIPDRLGIEHRPSEVKDRIIPGHWESDLIIGKEQQSALATLVERTTRFVMIIKLKSRKSEDVRKAIARELLELPSYMRKSMTHDNGIEMVEHKLLSKATNMVVYFAHPYSPWERGTNENTNMLIRDFFPKGTDFNEIPSGKIKRVQDLLNTRPRKTLNWSTPQEAFNECILKGKAEAVYTESVM